MLVNLTPHTVRVGNKEYPASGQIARVSSEHVVSGQLDGVPVYSVIYGHIENLPPESTEQIYIVSLLVLERGKSEGRSDLVAPASGAPGVVRDEKGQIFSVPGFVK